MPAGSITLGGWYLLPSSKTISLSVSVTTAEVPYTRMRFTVPANLQDGWSQGSGGVEPPNNLTRNSVQSVSELDSFIVTQKYPQVNEGIFAVIEIFYYLVILVTTPAPTVRPPSRIAKLRPCSIAIGCRSFTLNVSVSPGITISLSAGSSTSPVTSVVRK